MSSESVEQLGGLDVVERRDISPEELDELSQAVFGSTDIEDEVEDVSSEPHLVTSYLETFLTSLQLAAFEKAAEDSIVNDSKEATLWPRIRNGILLHPAVIGKLAVLSGIESLDDIDQKAWKDQGSCKEDVRFVSAGQHRYIQETRELMDVCEGCPVLAECEGHVINNFLQYGFWAGVSRSKGTGYHDDGTPITLEEKRDMMDARYGKAKSANT